ncbi:hypothetical protein BC835DRAFT_1284607 [Cytidiella melzeri]|nr:hypothetical protein BC835DRAFT_1284607 [Cytidiella melzeri]
MTSGPSLPADFKSVYRLFLRATASATLHSPRGTRHLRRQWKPFFQEAAIKHRKLHDSNHEAEHQSLCAWLNEWDRTVDNTMLLLYNSSHSRGLASRLTRNLSLLHRIIDTKRPEVLWKPQLSPDSSEYQIPKSLTTNTPKQAFARKGEELSRQSWNAIGEVVRMAEGTGQLSLGRIIKNMT